MNVDGNGNQDWLDPMRKYFFSRRFQRVDRKSDPDLWEYGYDAVPYNDYTVLHKIVIC
jgi:hypothetical protein